MMSNISTSSRYSSISEGVLAGVYLCFGSCKRFRNRWTSNGEITVIRHTISHMSLVFPGFGSGHAVSVSTQSSHNWQVLSHTPVNTGLEQVAEAVLSHWEQVVSFSLQFGSGGQND
mmetsp:Transcript_5274/g.8111  ORF Transcript_5274/g.8111 Transcript_5274/m.8111 type:complete len:116 (+) Transcript_5274:1043-1390(+)